MIYLVHYGFITWTQRALLPVAMPAGAKAVVVFAVTVACSWVVAQALIRVPGVRTLI